MEFRGGTQQDKATRARILSTVSALDGLSVGERQSVAYAYWYGVLEDKISEDDFEGAYQRLQLATIGASAFDGPDGILPGHVEGEPVGLLCGPRGVMQLIHLLYNAMRRANAIHVDMVCKQPKPWGPLFPSGARIAKPMGQHYGLAFQLAQGYALEIAASVYLHRRMGHA